MAQPIAEGCIPPGKAAPATSPRRWLISLDFDGTLREEEGPAVPPEFFRQMSEWRAAGVYWGINTGRTLDYLLEELLPCSPFLPDFICTCERYVYMAGEDRKLHPAQAHNEYCHQRNLKLRQNFVPLFHERLYTLHQDYPELTWEIAKTDPLSIEAADSATMDAIIPHLLPLITEERTIQRAGRYLRFSDAAFSKGTALQHVMQTWNIQERQVFIMGDGHNDLDAFRLFPEAFCAAPPTAHPEVLTWMRQHPRPCIPDQAGVLPALQTWFSERVSNSFS